MKRLLVAGLALVLAVAITSPALGGPSITSIAKTAKKALNTSKKAERGARSASRQARNAQTTADLANNRIGPIGTLANTANTKADQALARPVLNPVQIIEVPGPKATIPVLDVNSSIAFCPAGQRAISGGAEVFTGFFDSAAIQRATPGRTGWFAIAGNNSDTTTGTVQAFANCAPISGAVAASIPRARVRDEVARLVARLKAID